MKKNANEESWDVKPEAPPAKVKVEPSSDVQAMMERAQAGFVEMVGPAGRGLANVPESEVHSRKAQGWVLYSDYRSGKAKVEATLDLNPKKLRKSAP